MKKTGFLLLLFLQLLAQGQPGPYRVIAYYTGNGESIRQFPVSRLTHIIYSFLRLQNDTLAFRDDQQRSTVQQLVGLKKEFPNLKIMVSVGGWGGCGFCSGLFASEEHRRQFAHSAVALFKQYHIDGLDLDWEYPAIEGYPGHPYDTADKTHFTELVNALRREMGRDYLLSFAAGGFVKYLEQSIDWYAVLPVVDFVNLMTYDLVGGYSRITGHHTPLADYRPGQESVQKCIRWLINKKMPPDKLVIGAAFYARVWEQVAEDHHGLYQAGIFKQGVAYKDFLSYFSDSSGYHYYWDRKARAPYRYNPSQQLFATFDDERSIRLKARFVRRNKLGGIMFWELIEDKPSGGLVEVIDRALRR